MAPHVMTDEEIKLVTEQLTQLDNEIYGDQAIYPKSYTNNVGHSEILLCLFL